MFYLLKNQAKESIFLTVLKTLLQPLLQNSQDQFVQTVLHNSHETKS